MKIDPRVLKLLLLEWWGKQQWVDETRDDRWVEIDGSTYDMEELANWLILKLAEEAE